MKKDEKITKYQNMLKELKKEYKKEKQSLINDYTSNIEKLQASLADRTSEVDMNWLNTSSIRKPNSNRESVLICIFLVYGLMNLYYLNLRFDSFKQSLTMSRISEENVSKCRKNSTTSKKILLQMRKITKTHWRKWSGNFSRRKFISKMR